MQKIIIPHSGLQIKKSKQRWIMLPSVALLLFVLGFIFLPYAEAHLRASASSTSQAQIDVGISDAWASLSLHNTSSNGGTVLGSVAVSSDTLVVGKNSAVASTNSPNGYKLYLTASNTKDSTASMANTATGSTAKIAPKATTIGAFSTANQWGYAVKGTDTGNAFTGTYTTGKFTSGISNYSFKGASATGASDTPADGLIAQRSSAASNGALTDIYYGAYLNSSAPSGTYQASVTYTLVAESVTNNNGDGNTNANPNNPTVPGQESQDPNRQNSSLSATEKAKDRFAYVNNSGTPIYYNYSGSGVDASSDYYAYNASGNRVTAQGVNKTVDENKKAAATIANINDGNITWAAIAIAAGASATFLAIALLRDREDVDE